MTEPRLSAMRRQLKVDDIDITTAPLGLYFCFDTSTGRFTLLTFGLGLLHQHVREQFTNQDVCGGTRERSSNPLNDPFVLILGWCRGLTQEIEEIAALWYQRDEIYVSPIFRLCTSGLNSLRYSHSQSEKVMQASNHASNLKAAEFRHRMAVYTRDWLTSLQDSLVEIRKQHRMFMSDIFPQRNGVHANASYIELVDEQFGRLIMRSKDVEKVIHGVGRYDQRKGARGLSVPSIHQSYLSTHAGPSATRIRQFASRYRPQGHDPRQRRTGSRNSLTRDRQQAGRGDYEGHYGRDAVLSTCYIRYRELFSANGQRPHADDRDI